MKLSRISTIVLGGSLLLAAGALAQEKTTLTLGEKLTLAGTELKPGKYIVAWDGSGPNVQVSIHQGKNTVATVPATVIAKDSSNSGTGYETKKETDGSKSLVAIYPGGKKLELEVTRTQTAVGR